jgi:hypothetical protein
MLKYILNFEEIPPTFVFATRQSVHNIQSAVLVLSIMASGSSRHLCGDEICNILEEHEDKVLSDSESETVFDSSDSCGN